MKKGIPVDRTRVRMRAGVSGLVCRCARVFKHEWASFGSCEDYWMGRLGYSGWVATAATTASWQHFLQLKLVEHAILEDLWDPIQEEAVGSSCSLATSQTPCGPGLTTCPPRILLWIPHACHKPQPGIMALARLA